VSKQQFCFVIVELQESKVLVAPRERMDDVSAQMIIEVILRGQDNLSVQIVSKLVAVMASQTRQELLAKLFLKFPNAARDDILKTVRSGSTPVYPGSKVWQYHGLTTFLWV